MFEVRAARARTLPGHRPPPSAAHLGRQAQSRTGSKEFPRGHDDRQHDHPTRTPQNQIGLLIRQLWFQVIIGGVLGIAVGILHA